MKQRLVLLLLLIPCALAACAAFMRMIYAVLTAPERGWRLAVAFDQLFNTAANGNEDETVSSRAARAELRGKRWGCVLCRLLDVFDPRHCIKNIEQQFLKKGS